MDEKKEVENEEDSGKETVKKPSGREEKNQDNMTSLEAREESASLKVTTVSNAVDWLEVKTNQQKVFLVKCWDPSLPGMGSRT